MSLVTDAPTLRWILKPGSSPGGFQLRSNMTSQARRALKVWEETDQRSDRTLTPSTPDWTTAARIDPVQRSVTTNAAVSLDPPEEVANLSASPGFQANFRSGELGMKYLGRGNSGEILLIRVDREFLKASPPPFPGQVT